MTTRDSVGTESSIVVCVCVCVCVYLRVCIYKLNVKSEARTLCWGHVCLKHVTVYSQDTTEKHVFCMVHVDVCVCVAQLLLPYLPQIHSVLLCDLLIRPKDV